MKSLATGAYIPYVTEPKRKFDEVFATRIPRSAYPNRKRGRRKQDQGNADLATGAYITYVTEPKRKFDEVLRSVSPVYFNSRIS